MNDRSRELGLPSEVNAILDWWLPRVRDCLTESLTAVYLSGGLALGEFAPGWSDVDVCVVLGREITDSEATWITAVHDEMDERFLRSGELGWRSGQAVEGPYVPRSICADAEAAAACLRTWGPVRDLSEGPPFSPFDRLALSGHGRCILGEEVVFVPPRREQLLAQLEEDVSSLSDPERIAAASPIWLAGTLMWIARSIVYWRDGRLVGKSAALQEEIDSGSPFTDAFRPALACREDGSESAAASETELRGAVREMAGPAADLLRSLAKTTEAPRMPAE